MKALHFSRLAALIAAAVLPIALAAPASAATSVTFDCQADAPIVGPQKVALNQDADVTAPATVAPGGAFDVVIDPAPNTVPSTVSGNKVKNINTFALKIPIPANSSYVGADLTGGSGLGSTPPALSVA
ncbi:cyclase, partial [Amycolatopsis mediterranei]